MIKIAIIIDGEKTKGHTDADGATVPEMALAIAVLEQRKKEMLGFFEKYTESYKKEKTNPGDEE